MQSAKTEPQVTITVRDESITGNYRNFIEKKIETLNLEYPKIIEVKVLLDVVRKDQVAQIILFCTNNITIDASTESDDMHRSIDETVSKLARRMRKQKTRLLKKQRPAKGSGHNSIRYLDEKVFGAEALDHLESSPSDPEPLIVHRENYRLKTMLKEDALMELELSDRPFLLYRNERRGTLQIVYRRSDGEYALVPVPES